MPKMFQRLGISFRYPDNWVLDDSDAKAGRGSVTVYAPEGSFWTVSVHHVGAEPVSLARSVVDAMREEYAAVEVEQIKEEIAGYDLVGYDMNFFYLDFSNSAQVRSLRLGDRTLTVFCQGEDREFDHLSDVFRAMTTSLLRDSAGAADRVGGRL